MAKLYDELADWWPLISPPADYRKEAAALQRVLDESCAPPPRTLLELGSGGGHNACFLKQHYQVTLVDLSPRMLRVSQALNPELEHLEGDMRTLRLGRRFDAVLINDAICYMTTVADLSAALRTAREHCRPGGAALLCPDFVRETYQPGVETGGVDGGRRSARYLEWRGEPDAAGGGYPVDYAFMLRDETGALRVVHDHHVEGLFPRQVWLDTLGDAGFAPRALKDEWGRDLFVGVTRDPATSG